MAEDRDRKYTIKKIRKISSTMWGRKEENSSNLRYNVLVIVVVRALYICLDLGQQPYLLLNNKICYATELQESEKRG
jgi:hypothetical protein